MWQQSYVIYETGSCSLFRFLSLPLPPSLSSVGMGEDSCHSLWIFKQPCGEVDIKRAETSHQEQYQCASYVGESLWRPSAPAKIPGNGRALAYILIATSWKAWIRTAQLSCSWTPDSQKLCDTKCLLFLKSLSLWHVVILLSHNFPWILGQRKMCLTCF